MQLQENYPLKNSNSFGVNATAKYFTSFNSLDSLDEALQFAATASMPLLVLGGGSNLLFTKDFNGLVIKNELTGIEKLNEDADFVYVKVAAGENWHQFVLHCVNNGWAGVENLSLIPGNAGASPMQNIGAYGVEIKDVFHSLEAYHIAGRQLQKFNLDDCRFGYRESVFKKTLKDQYVIGSVTYRLRKTPVFNTSYGAIEQELERMGITTLSIKAISDAVINIRSSKLPNPAEIGNAGSFFKNPEIEKDHFEKLKNVHPKIAGFPLANGNVKLAAGWLIEQCGPDENTSWKGFREGDAGCYAKQALVLVNYGTASGAAVLQLSEKIVRSVAEKFGVLLEREVNII